MVFCGLIAEDRKHVSLYAVFDSVVDVAVQMDRQVRDRHQIASCIDQNGFYAVSIADHHTAC